MYRCKPCHFEKMNIAKCRVIIISEYIIVSIVIVFYGGLYKLHKISHFLTIIKYIETYFTLENHRFQFLVDVPTRARSFCLQNG